MFKRHQRIFILCSLLIILSIGIVACNNNTTNSSEHGNNEKSEAKKEKNDGEKPSKGGTITGAIFSAPSGMFNPVFYGDSYENNILQFTHESLVEQNDKLEFIPKLATNWKMNKDQTAITFKLKKGVKWHDGEKFTAHDVVFTYKTMSDPDYIPAGGIWVEYVQPLLEYGKYSSGETDKFTAVVADDDYTVTFKFAESTVNPLYYASFPIIPEHIFGKLPVAEIPSVAESRDPGKVIGTGPFKFTKMVERESYTLERNKEYWQGVPYLDKIVWKVVAPPIITKLLESGEIDLIANPDGITPEDFDTIKKLDSINIIEQVDFSYQALGFKLNHRETEDVENGLLEPDNWKPNKKLADPKIRQAIAYAINREEMIDELLNGHGKTINTPIPPQMWAYDKDAADNYKFNPDKARSILDDLGYIDTDDDGFRENPDGKKWTLHLNYPKGNPLRERSAEIITEQLEDVGIKIKLRKPKEMNSYIEELSNDDSDWDLFLIGWNMSTNDPNPTDLWETKVPYNFSRWNNDASDELMQEGLQVPDAFDQAYRAKIYSKWQTLFANDLPAFIFYAPKSIWATNNRLQGIDPLPFTMYNNTHLWWVEK